MTYKGYDILLEFQHCELFTLNDKGETSVLMGDCPDHNDLLAQYIAVDRATGKRLFTHSTFEACRRRIDIAEEIKKTGKHLPGCATFRPPTPSGCMYCCDCDIRAPHVLIIDEKEAA